MNFDLLLIYDRMIDDKREMEQIERQTGQTRSLAESSVPAPGTK